MHKDKKNWFINASSKDSINDGQNSQTEHIVTAYIGNIPEGTLKPLCIAIVVIESTRFPPAESPTSTILFGLNPK